MTPSQERFLRFVDEVTRADGIPPTIREIMAEFGHTSTNSVADMAGRLEGAGFLRERGRGKSRAFVLTDAVRAAIGSEVRAVYVVDSGMDRGVWFRDYRTALDSSRSFTRDRVPHRMYRAVSK